MVEPSRLLYVASAASIAALALATFAVATRPGAGSGAETGTKIAPSAASADVDGALAREIAELRAEIAELRSRTRLAPDDAVAALARRVADLEEAASKRDLAEPSASESARAAAPRPRYASFDVPNSAVRVQQGTDGSLSVTNADPSLTGQTLVVQARRANGTVDSIPISVPAP